MIRRWTNGLSPKTLAAASRHRSAASPSAQYRAQVVEQLYTETSSPISCGSQSDRNAARFPGVVLAAVGLAGFGWCWMYNVPLPVFEAYQNGSDDDEAPPSAADGAEPCGAPNAAS
mgnify:CR=1 FL=1